MEPEGLLPCSQEPTAGSYHEQMKEVNFLTPYPFNLSLILGIWMVQSSDDGGAEAVW